MGGQAEATHAEVIETTPKVLITSTRFYALPKGLGDDAAYPNVRDLTFRHSMRSAECTRLPNQYRTEVTRPEMGVMWSVSTHEYA